MAHSATGRNSSPLTRTADEGGYGGDDTEMTKKAMIMPFSTMLNSLRLPPSPAEALASHGVSLVCESRCLSQWQREMMAPGGGGEGKKVG